MPEIDVDPTTRIEGHHAVTMSIEDGVVASARSEMDMFRGIESIVIGRPPSDTPQIAQMICGVCFTCQRQASVMAVEDAAMRAGQFDGPPEQAKLLRDIMEGLFLLWNHSVHLFTLAGPDYGDNIGGTGFERIDPADGEGTKTALRQQRVLLQAFAEFGGRSPHPLTYVPGGMATTLDEEAITEVRQTLDSVNDWIGPSEAVSEALVEVQHGNARNENAQGLYDMLSILVGAKREGADEFGVAPPRFYTNGLFYGRDADSLFTRGVAIDGDITPVSRDEVVDNLREDVAFSWYTEESGGRPAAAPPPEPDPDAEDAYSWGKAPRYDGQSMETGPLARLVMDERDPYNLRERLAEDPSISTTLTRLIARVQEFLFVRDKLRDWLDALDPEGTFAVNFDDDFSGEGIGLWGASRGALSHWCTVEDGEVTQYQVISPTAWNLGPRDKNGTPSILEHALEGIPVEDPTNPVDVMRTIRSYDPCLGCAVHVQSPDVDTDLRFEPVGPLGSMDGE